MATNRRKKKTVEEIKKTNLAKTLDKMKEVVAEREQVWLDAFMQFVTLCEIEDLTEARLERFGELADVVLRVYEARWGQGG